MATRVITLMSEGPTDVGALADPWATWEEKQEGFLQHVLSRCVPQHDLLFFDGSALVLDLQTPASVSSALERKAYAAGALAAYQHQAHVVVLVVDTDNDDDPIAHRLAPMQAGLAAGVEAVQGPQPQIVAGLARRTIEAWVLGDVSAVEQAAGARFVGPVPHAPEQLWGTPNDPSSNHPKQVLRRVFGGRLTRDDYRDVGAVADPSAVVAACPAGFAPFQEAFVDACS